MRGSAGPPHHVIDLVVMGAEKVAVISRNENWHEKQKYLHCLINAKI